MIKFKMLLIFVVMTVSAQSQNFKYGRVSEAEVKETSHPLDKDADAAVLFREQNTSFEILENFEFSVVTEVHERIKIYSTDGFDWATKEIHLYNKEDDAEEVEDLEGVTYNLIDGELVKVKLEEKGIFEERIDDNNHKTTLAMPAVAEGSVIEFRYTVKSPFWTVIDKVKLQETIPMNKVEFSVAIPSFLGYKFHFNPKSSIVFEAEKDERTASAKVQYSDVARLPTVPSRESQMSYRENVISIHKDNIPALRTEVYAGYLPSHAASMEMELQYINLPDTPLKNYAYTWEGVAQSIYSEGKYEKELKEYNVYLEDLRLLMNDVTKPQEKARAVYQFIKDKVKWNGDYGFIPDNGNQKTYTEGEGNVGDINVLLTSMMKFAGLEAFPVLVSTEKNGLPLYPTRSGFNYVICAVNIEGEQYLLDATETNSDFGELPSRARNWRGRLLYNNERSEWVDLMPKNKSSFKTVLNLTFEDDLTLTGKTTNVLEGLYAKAYRDRFAGIAPDSYIPFLENEKKNIKIQDLIVENDREIGTAVRETFNFLLKDELEQINGRIYFQPLLFEKIEENPFKAEQRILPIYFDFPKEKIALVNMKIPEGYAVESLPESIVLNFGKEEGTYKFIVKLQGQYLRIESHLEWNSIAFPPEYYADIKKFYNTIVEKNSEVIVLKKL